MLASAEAVGTAMEMLEPHLAKSGVKSKGKVIVATVKGDLHDIGKNIVSILLRGAGYTVKDLGNDIEPKAIVDAVKEESHIITDVLPDKTPKRILNIIDITSIVIFGIFSVFMIYHGYVYTLKMYHFERLTEAMGAPLYYFSV